MWSEIKRVSGRVHKVSYLSEGQALTWHVKVNASIVAGDHVICHIGVQLVMPRPGLELDSAILDVDRSTDVMIPA